MDGRGGPRPERDGSGRPQTWQRHVEDRTGPADNVQKEKAAAAHTKPDALLCFRTHVRKQDHIPNRCLVSHQHNQPVDANTLPSGWRHAVL
jgi:hypothetical protein